MVGKSLIRCGLAVALSLLLTNALQAQGRGRMGLMGQGVAPLSIISFEPVQKELGLKPEQADKLKDLASDVRDERTQQFQGAGIDFAGLQGLSGEERDKRMAEIRTKMGEISKNLNDKFLPNLAAILDEKQRTRLQEIAVQVAGSQALQDADVVKALALTKEQQTKLTELVTENGKKMRELFDGGGGDRQQNAAKMAELREDLSKKAGEVLTKEQQDKFAKMKGKTFDVASLRSQGRRQAN